MYLGTWKVAEMGLATSLIVRFGADVDVKSLSFLSLLKIGKTSQEWTNAIMKAWFSLKHS